MFSKKKCENQLDLVAVSELTVEKSAAVDNKYTAKVCTE